MKFDARVAKSPEKKEAFVAWLTGETVSILQRAGEDPEKLKSATFLFMNRARESGIAELEIAEIIGVSIARAGLRKEDEEVVLDYVEAFDSLATATHSNSPQRKSWWRFW